MLTANTHYNKARAGDLYLRLQNRRMQTVFCFNCCVGVSHCWQGPHSLSSGRGVPVHLSVAMRPEAMSSNRRQGSGLHRPPISRVEPVGEPVA